MDDSQGIVKEEPNQEDDDLFYFESDHLALRGNKEYSEVLKTIVILESIREKALKDYEVVVQLQKQMLEDPAPIIRKLLNNEPIGVPDLYKIPEVPAVDWKKFNVPIPEQSLREINGEGSTVTSTKNTSDDLRPKNSSSTHSKPWTAEEQKRLEELLIIYPPEAVELRRFKKIAAALGNRTVKQVCSRVQKYFQKLYKAGLPIPGRIPKNLYDRKKPHKHQRHNHYLWRPSTFFPELDIPVVMNDEDVPGPSQSSKEGTGDYSSTSSQQNYLLPNNYHDDNPTTSNKSGEELQLEILKRVKYEKQKCEGSDEAPFQHVGFRCDYCGENPILGSRWHCSTCLNDSIDFCTDCVVSQMYSNSSHPLTHKFIVIRNNKTSSDTISSDYSEDDSNTDS